MEERKSAVRILATLVLILAVITFVLRFVYQYTSADTSEKYVHTGVIHGLTADEVRERLSADIPRGTLRAEMNKDITMKSGNPQAELRIENIAANHYGIIVTLTEDVNDTLLYKSPLVSPNEYIEYAPLLQELPIGDYACTAKVEAFDLLKSDGYQEEDAPVGSTTLPVKIYVIA